MRGTETFSRVQAQRQMCDVATATAQCLPDVRERPRTPSLHDFVLIFFFPFPVQFPDKEAV